MPAAVSERPPRNGPIGRYFIPLKGGSSCSLFSGSSVFAEVAIFCSGFLVPSVCFWASTTPPHAHRIAANTNRFIVTCVRDLPVLRLFSPCKLVNHLCQ